MLDREITCEVCGVNMLESQWEGHVHATETFTITFYGRGIGRETLWALLTRNRFAVKEITNPEWQAQCRRFRRMIEGL